MSLTIYDEHTLAQQAGDRIARISPEELLAIGDQHLTVRFRSAYDSGAKAGERDLKISPQAVVKHLQRSQGEGFLRRVSGQSGDDALPRMVRQHAVQFPPWLDGRTVRKVTGTGLHAQWAAWVEAAGREFAREAEARGRLGLTESRPLTARGIRQVAPRFSPDGALVAYSSQTLTRFPEIRLVRADGSDDRRLTLRNGGSGLSWTPDGKALVHAELQVHETYTVFGDLSLVSVENGKPAAPHARGAGLRP